MNDTYKYNNRAGRDDTFKMFEDYFLLIGKTLHYVWQRKTDLSLMIP